MRQNFEQGMEILHSDLNSLQARLLRGLYDQAIYEMIGRKTDGFFQNGFYVSRVSGTSVSVKAGMGFQAVSVLDTIEPTKKPVYLGSDHAQAIDTPHATLSRIDIICVKADLQILESETRRYKEEFEDTIYTQTFTISKKDGCLFSYVAGTPNASPSVPATPAGFIKIAEITVSASTGIASQSSIKDSRSLLPLAIDKKAGGLLYDAVVGTEDFCTHATLNDVMADLNVLNIKNILVVGHASISSTQTINQSDLRIEFKRGVTLTGTAPVGITISGNGCEIIGARFNGLTSGVQIDSGAKNNSVMGCRFLACTNDILDNGTNSILSMNMTEV
jgi:hypothetical protein